MRAIVDMGLHEKLANAKKSDWLKQDIPKWKLNLIIWWAKFKARVVLKIK